MGAGINSVNDKYSSAMKSYNQALKNLGSKIEDYSGEKGYGKAMELASRGANVYAGDIKRQATNAARASGLNKYQAAALGAMQGAGAYANALQGQQNQATNQLQSQLSNLNALASQRANQVGYGQTEGQNEYNRAWGNIGNTMGVMGSFAKGAGVLSDARMKTGCNISELSKRIDDILAAGKSKPRSYKDLMITKEV